MRDDSMNGNDGDSGGVSADSVNSGNITITGDMTISVTSGILSALAFHESSGFGKYDHENNVVVEYASGGGGAGGSGGFPFLGAKIGTGGVGGAGGGAGGSGAVDYDGALPFFTEIYAACGGGGGAGFGFINNPLVQYTFGGLANPYNPR